MVPGPKGREIVALLEQNIVVTLHITIGTRNLQKYVSRTSVVFVSISFIVLMIISLAWLVFYYIQRFRYANARDRNQVWVCTLWSIKVFLSKRILSVQGCSLLTSVHAFFHLVPAQKGCKERPELAWQLAQQRRGKRTMNWLRFLVFLNQQFKFFLLLWMAASDHLVTSVNILHHCACYDKSRCRDNHCLLFHFELCWFISYKNFSHIEQICFQFFSFGSIIS